MKFKCLLIISALLFFVAPSNSEILTEEMIMPEQMINYNYSETMADYPQLVKAQSHNQEYKSERRNYSLWKKIWYYFDPAYDNGRLMQHNIHPGNSWYDW